MRVWCAERARKCADSLYAHLEKDLIDATIDRIKRAARRGAYKVEINNPNALCYADSFFERYINSNNVKGFVQYFVCLGYRVNFIDSYLPYRLSQKEHYDKIEIAWGEQK